MDVTKGILAEQLLMSEAWQLIVEILERYKQDQLNELVSYGGSDPTILRSKQLSARIMQGVRDSLERDLNDLVQYAKAELLAQRSTGGVTHE